MLHYSWNTKHQTKLSFGMDIVNLILLDVSKQKEKHTKLESFSF